MRGPVLLDAGLPQDRHAEPTGEFVLIEDPEGDNPYPDSTIEKKNLRFVSDLRIPGSDLIQLPNDDYSCLKKYLIITLVNKC